MPTSYLTKDPLAYLKTKLWRQATWVNNCEYNNKILGQCGYIFCVNESTSNLEYWESMSVKLSVEIVFTTGTFSWWQMLLVAKIHPQAGRALVGQVPYVVARPPLRRRILVVAGRRVSTPTPSLSVCHLQWLLVGAGLSSFPSMHAEAKQRKAQRSLRRAWLRAGSKQRAGGRRQPRVLFWLDLAWPGRWRGQNREWMPRNPTGCVRLSSQNRGRPTSNQLARVVARRKSSTLSRLGCWYGEFLREAKSLRLFIVWFLWITCWTAP
jgi:hypothetical protein